MLHVYSIAPSSYYLSEAGGGQGDGSYMVADVCKYLHMSSRICLFCSVGTDCKQFMYTGYGISYYQNRLYGCMYVIKGSFVVIL